VEPEDILADLDALVRSALSDGAMTLADVTARVLSGLPVSTHYAATGRAVEVLARVSAVRSDRERPWAPVGDRLEVEDWAVLELVGVS